MIRECRAADAERIHLIINEAAQAYKGVIQDEGDSSLARTNRSGQEAWLCHTRCYPYE